MLNPSPSTQASILKDLDRCVMCGMCAPHCPTYELHQTESESPRGRIQLMAAAWKEQLPLGSSSQQHLASCLLCRACESMCPAGVPFETLMNKTRAMHNWPSTPVEKAQRGFALLHNQPLIRTVVRGLYWYRKWGLQRLARASGMLRWLGFARADAILPPLAPPRAWSAFYPAPAGPRHRGTVALFTGCVTYLIDQDATLAAVTLLNASGYDVSIPPNQTCCGALHAHSGDLATAAELAVVNGQAFAAAHVTACLSLTPGCTTTLMASSIGPVAYHDVCAFFVQHKLVDGMTCRALSKRVAVHIPCSQRFLGGAAHTTTLLAAIPELDMITLDQKLCCGAAGTHMLTHACDADAFMDMTLDALAKTHAEMVVTTNVGCAMLMRHGLARRKMKVEVMHPLALLQRQLANVAVYSGSHPSVN